MDLFNLPDEELVKLSRSGGTQADEILYDRYRNLVRKKAHPYFLVGADKEDLIQEGMIGFFKAIRDYDESQGTLFRSFAEVCITRQIITAIKSATRKKHMPLNSYISIYADSESTGGVDTAVQMQEESPEEAFIARESFSALLSKLRLSLSPFENQTLTYFLQGLSYTQIAEKVGKSPKTTDNALQRIKKKAEKLIDS